MGLCPRAELKRSVLASSWRAAAAICAAAAAGAFAACATGGEIDDTSGSGGEGASGGQGGGSGIEPGQIGGPCEKDEDCAEGECTAVGSGKVCTVPCPPQCPSGTYCAIVEGDSLCVPDLDQQCLQCKGSVDCKHPSDECLKAPAGDKFCARDCTTMGDCPNGFECVESAAYAAGGAGGAGGASPDAGAPDAGGSDAGPVDGGAGDAGQGPADAGKDGGGSKPPSGMPYKFCVPKNGGSCPCNDKRDGVKHACEASNALGACKGEETCDGDKGAWVGCTAKTPKSEACNVQDDDCDGAVDEGEGNELCSAEGPPPPNASWKCQAGKCSLGPCDPGWAAFPPGPVEDGCSCPLEAGEDNGTCAKPEPGGAVTDMPGSEVFLEGTLSADADVDVWMVETVDTPENGTNSYHVSIAFVAPAKNEELVMDVMRGESCSDAPKGPGSSITSYDWCVNGTAPNGAEGEGTCSADGAVHCNDNSAVYYVRVHRKPGAKATCAKYSIKVVATADGCDFDQKCP